MNYGNITNPYSSWVYDDINKYWYDTKDRYNTDPNYKKLVDSSNEIHLNLLSNSMLFTLQKTEQ